MPQHTLNSLSFMPSLIEIWKMLAGVAFFLLAMYFMEDSLRLLAGRRFKLFLKKQTTNRVKAILGGAIVTALLQSSSIANLLVLGMVGAGVVMMKNALGLMLGSNLGTTFSSWMIATLGFQFNIETAVLPVAGITGIGMAFLPRESRLHLWVKFIFSLSFLFVSLGFIKEGMGEFVQQTDLSSLNDYPVILFFFTGILLTAVVQSSSVTIALALSALYSEAITLLMAMAVTLGAEIGTTLKFFLVSVNGPAIKKRVALGNFLFNIVTVLIMLALLFPLNRLITRLFGTEENLFALVFFQSLVNMVSIFLFFPFLNLLGKFLLQQYPDKGAESLYIRNIPAADTDPAIEALENETRHLAGQVIHFTLDAFDLVENSRANHLVHRSFLKKTTEEKYTSIKLLHGEMHAYCLKLQHSPVNEKEADRLSQLMAAMRNTMYAAKSIHDALDDIRQVRNSSNDIKYAYYQQSRQNLQEFYSRITRLLNKENNNYTETLRSSYNLVTEGYTHDLQRLYKDSFSGMVNELDTSTLINLNRQLYTSLKSILFALKDYLLSAEEAAYFENLPGFIR